LTKKEKVLIFRQENDSNRFSKNSLLKNGKNILQGKTFSNNRDKENLYPEHLS